jgi:hypothetical protein
MAQYLRKLPDPDVALDLIEPGSPASVIAANEFFGSPAPPPTGGGAATWFTPSAPFQVTPDTAPDQYYQATLAWSHRYAVNQLDYPRATNRMVLPNHGYLDLQGENDDTGLNMLAVAESWAYIQASFTFPSGGFVEPDETGNYVMIWDQAGGLSSGHYAQIWRNGVLVGYLTTQLTDYGLRNLRLLGEGSTVLPGETQGFWFSADTAMDPAAMFDTLFDGANGMLDINADPTIDGVYPDNFYIEPGEGPSGITGTASGIADVTGAATGTLRLVGEASGSADTTGAASGSIRANAQASGAADVTGAAAGVLRDVGTAAGVADVSGAASGALRAAATVSGTVDVSGAASGTLRVAASANGAADVSGTATGALRVSAAVSGTADVTGTAVGTVSGSGAIASGIADVTGQATGTLRVAAAVLGTADVTGAATGSIRARAVVSGTVEVTGSAAGTLRATATASGTADVTGSAEGELSSGSITAEVAGIADVTGQATASLRLLAVVSGLADVTGTASDLGDTSRHILVSGMWLENIETGFWQAANVSGIWRENIVQGEWA